MHIMVFDNGIEVGSSSRLPGFQSAREKETEREIKRGGGGGEQEGVGGIKRLFLIK